MIDLQLKIIYIFCFQRTNFNLLKTLKCIALNEKIKLKLPFVTFLLASWKGYPNPELPLFTYVPALSLGLSSYLWEEVRNEKERKISCIFSFFENTKIGRNIYCILATSNLLIAVRISLLNHSWLHVSNNRKTVKKHFHWAERK